MATALKGTEFFQVVPVQANGQPTAALQQVTTQDVANLSAGGSTSTLITALNTVGAGTITAAGIYGKITARGGTQSGAAFTDTTDTAANIIAALPTGAVVGTAFKYTYENTTNAAATLTGGTGVTVSGVTVVPAGQWAEFLVTYSAANTITMVGYEMGANSSELPAQFVTNTTTTTFAAGQLTGSEFQVYANTGNTPGTITTRTAAQMIADIPNASVGLSWVLRIYHGGTGTLTVAAGTNVTLTGTATIATTTFRDFLCTITSATAITMQNIGSGTA